LRIRFEISFGKLRSGFLFVMILHRRDFHFKTAAFILVYAMAKNAEDAEL